MYSQRQNGFNYPRQDSIVTNGLHSDDEMSSVPSDTPHINMITLGPGYWDLIHRLTINVRTSTDRLMAILFTKFLINNFPCVDPCKKHIQEYEKLYPLDKVEPSAKDEKGRDLSLFKWW